MRGQEEVPSTPPPTTARSNAPAAPPPYVAPRWVAQDLTACRDELASIAILLQEREQLPDPGGDNYALVAGAVLRYVVKLEAQFDQLEEELREAKWLRAEETDDLRKTIVMLWDLMPLDDCVRFSGISPVRYNTVNDLWAKWDQQQKAGIYTLSIVDECDLDCDEEHHAPMCPRWDGHAAANCCGQPEAQP